MDLTRILLPIAFALYLLAFTLYLFHFIRRQGTVAKWALAAVSLYFELRYPRGSSRLAGCLVHGDRRVTGPRLLLR